MLALARLRICSKIRSPKHLDAFSPVVRLLSQAKSNESAHEPAVKTKSGSAQDEFGFSVHSLQPVQNHEWFVQQFRILKEEHRPLDAIKLLERAKSHNAKFPIGEYYTLVLSNLGANGGFEDCFGLYQQKISEKHTPVEKDYVSVIRSCINSKPAQWSPAKNFFNQLASSLDCIPLTILAEGIKAAVSGGCASDGLKLYQEYKSKTDIKDRIKLMSARTKNAAQRRDISNSLTEFYSSALEMCCKIRDKALAESICTEYKSIGFKLDTQMYHYMITINIEDMNKYLSIIEDMKANKVALGSDTAKILLNAHKEAKRVEYIGKSFIRDLIAMHIKPTLDVFEMAFTEYAIHTTNPQIRTFQLMLGQMKDQRIEPSVEIWRAYLYLSMRLQNTGEVITVFKKLRLMEASMDLWAYLGILRMLHKSKDYTFSNPIFKHAIYSLLMLDELGLWYPEMDMDIPGPGRWMPMKKRQDSYMEIVGKVKQKYLKPIPNMVEMRKQQQKTSSMWKEPIPSLQQNQQQQQQNQQQTQQQTQQQNQDGNRTKIRIVSGSRFLVLPKDKMKASLRKENEFSE